MRYSWRMHRISIALVWFFVALITLTLAPVTARAAPDGAIVMGEAGDRWLDIMQYRRIERTTVDGVFGYALTFHGADGGDLVFFYPRGAIDLAGEKPLTTRRVMDVPGGRVWYPDKLTVVSLPRAYEAILWIESKYRADARGGIKAMEAFVVLFGAAEAAPVLTTLTVRVFTSRAKDRVGIALLEESSAVSASQAGAKVTTRVASSAGQASRSTATASALETAEKSVPEASSIVRTGLTPAAMLRRVAAKTGGSRRALARALQKAGYKRPPGSAVHHIVAHSAKSAKPAREVLQKFGIHIDDAANGVFLPATKMSPNPGGAAVHSTLHTEIYYEKVNKLLTGASTRAEVEERLMQLRKALLEGTM